MNVCWLEICGSINSKMLSKCSNYSAYLIFKLSNNASGFKYPLQEASVTIGAHISKYSVRLMEELDSSFRSRPILGRPRFLRNLFRRVNLSQEPSEVSSDEDLSNERDEPQDRSQRDCEMVGKPQTRKDGWMEILLGEFYNEEGDDGDIVMSFLEVKGGNWKSGLIVQGIEIRPKN